MQTDAVANATILVAMTRDGSDACVVLAYGHPARAEQNEASRVRTHSTRSFELSLFVCNFAARGTGLPVGVNECQELKHNRRRTAAAGTRLNRGLLLPDMVRIGGRY